MQNIFIRCYENLEIKSRRLGFLPNKKVIPIPKILCYSMALIGDEYTCSTLHLVFYENFLSQKETKCLTDSLESDIVKWRTTPSVSRRCNATYGDEGLTYVVNFRNGTSVRKALPWDDFTQLIPIRDKLTKLTHQEYNICVVQRYPSGRVGIAPHRDKEMTPGTTICGISLGETRTLSVSRGKKTINLSLVPGSLYIFYPPTNDYWTHCIEKDDTTNTRYSLTFRNYQSE